MLLVRFHHCQISFFSGMVWGIEIYPDVPNTRGHFWPARVRWAEYKTRRGAVRAWREFAQEYGIQWRELDEDRGE